MGHPISSTSKIVRSIGQFPFAKLRRMQLKLAVEPAIEPVIELSDEQLELQ
jgi:hypothetical protein